MTMSVRKLFKNYNKMVVEISLLCTKKSSYPDQKVHLLKLVLCLIEY